MNAGLDHPGIARVQKALQAAGSTAQVMILSNSARTAQQAADALGCPVGAIVKSLVFACDGQAYMALVSGDRRCDTDALARHFNLPAMDRADADLVRRATGFAIGGVAPLGHLEPLPIVLDESLRRFEWLYAAAGHPHAVFPTSVDELIRLTDARPAAIGLAAA